MRLLDWKIMTHNNSFKKKIRARMKVTGETYAQAREALYKRTFPLDFLLSSGLSLPVNKSNAHVVVEDIFSGQELNDIRTSISQRHHILVCGGAYTGKTFTLNAILNSNSVINPTHRVITIEENMKELIVGNYSFSLVFQPKEYAISDLLTSSLRMRPDTIAVGEIRCDEMWMMDRLGSVGTTSFTTCHSRSISQLAGYMGANNFPQLTTIVMVDRFKVGEHNLFLKAVIPLTDEVREALETYRQGYDEDLLNATLDSLGVVTIDSKRRELAKRGIRQQPL